MTEFNHETPDLKDRLQALIIDTIIIFALMFVFYKIFDALGEVDDNWRMWAVIFLFIIYDPLFTSLFGGTLGHYAMGLRVRNVKKPEKRIHIFAAAVRFAVKAFFGLISLIVISVTSKGQGLHDLIAGSVVITKKKPVQPKLNEELLDTEKDLKPKDMGEEVL